MTVTAQTQPDLITVEGIGTVRVHQAKKPRAVLAMIPGFGCAARRYDWLASLTQQGVSVLIPELADIEGLIGMQHLFAHLRLYGVPIYLAGHSAGGALTLDALESDPTRNQAIARPDNYSPPQDIAGAIVMGASLQPQLLTFVLPYRQEDTPVSRPKQTRLLFITGTHDAIATPERVARTVQRYDTPAQQITIEGGDHYGFVQGREPTDNPSSGYEGAIDGEALRQLVLGHLSDFLAA